MKKASLLSVRVTEELAGRLENLARALDRSKSYLAAQAIEEFVALQEWQVEAIQEGITAVEQGEVVDHAEAVAVLKKWGSSKNAA